MSAPEPAIPTSNPRTRAIPVVVLIAKELTYEEQALLTQRVRGLLAKGKIAPELLHQVKAVLEPGRARRGSQNTVDLR